MELKEEKISSEHIFKGKIVDLRRDEVRLPDGSKSMREVISHPGGACIVAIDSEDNILLVRQFRYPFKRPVLELPAGKLEYGEDPLKCAERELSEETGFEALNMTSLGEFYPTPAYDEEISYVFYADKLKKTKQHLDEGEFLEIVKIPFCEALKMVMDGRIKDGKTCIGILKAHNLRK